VIRAVVQKHFDQALDSMPPRNDMTDPGLIVQFGETILHLQGMVERIAKELAHSSFHGQNADRALDQGFVEGGNMGALVDTTAKFKTHTALK
jgi:acyl-coenzyme A thioesterase PaaI-like protein